MGLTVRNTGGGEFEQVPEGVYVARCFKLIDLGSQESEWNGEKKSRPKVMITWEILDDDVRMKDGRPFAISKRYTASLNERAVLRADLQAWRGKRFTDEELEGFDLKSVLGAYCSMQVVHEHKNGTTYENVDAIMSTREKPAPVNDLVHFDLADFDSSVFESFSERMKDTIKASAEYQALDSFSDDTAGDSIVADDYPSDEDPDAVNDLDSAPSQEKVKHISPGDRKKIVALATDLGATTKDARLELVSVEVGRDIESTIELTADEAAHVIAVFTKRKAAGL